MQSQQGTIENSSGLIHVPPTNMAPSQQQQLTGAKSASPVVPPSQHQDLKFPTEAKIVPVLSNITYALSLQFPTNTEDGASSSTGTNRFHLASS